MGLSLALACMALVFFWAAGVRQRLLAERQGVVHAFAQLDQQLQVRHEALAEVLAAAQPAVPMAREALDRVAAARLQVMAAAELVRSGPAQAGPIKSFDLAEASFDVALQGLSAWVDQALAVMWAEPAVSPEADAGEAFTPTAMVPPLAAAWQRLSQAGQGVQFACLACNQKLLAHNEAVQRLPARLVAALVGARGLPLLTVINHA